MRAAAAGMFSFFLASWEGRTVGQRKVMGKEYRHEQFGCSKNTNTKATAVKFCQRCNPPWDSPLLILWLVPLPRRICHVHNLTLYLSFVPEYKDPGRVSRV